MILKAAKYGVLLIMNAFVTFELLVHSIFLKRSLSTNFKYLVTAQTIHYM